MRLGSDGRRRNLDGNLDAPNYINEPIANHRVLTDDTGRFAKTNPLQRQRQTTERSQIVEDNQAFSKCEVLATEQ
jgi:hypothetical protein